jgi:hypothetical protein
MRTVPRSAAGGIRTLKPLRAAGFEPALYASSSTAAGEVRDSRYQPGDGHRDYPSVTGVSLPNVYGAVGAQTRTLTG